MQESLQKQYNKNRRLHIPKVTRVNKTLTRWRQRPHSKQQTRPTSAPRPTASLVWAGPQFQFTAPHHPIEGVGGRTLPFPQPALAFASSRTRPCSRLCLHPHRAAYHDQPNPTQPPEIPSSRLHLSPFLSFPEQKCKRSISYVKAILPIHTPPHPTPAVPCEANAKKKHLRAGRGTVQ